MASREDDEATRHVREIRPGGSGAGNQGSASTTRIAQPAKKAPEAGGQGPTIIHGGNEGHTVIHGREPPPLEGGQRSKTSEEPYQPVTGWLVAVSGPGKGKARSVFEGMNSVGRDPEQRIVLDFDDPEISRKEHFFVTYEPKKRLFHISIGNKANLVYLNGEVLLSHMPLTEGAEIEVGKTKLRFVPLCGPGFSWDEA
jgi:hypothetical protein